MKNTIIANWLCENNQEKLMASLHFGTSAGKAHITRLNARSCTITFMAESGLITPGNRVTGVIIAGIEDIRFMGVIKRFWAGTDGEMHASLKFTKKANLTAARLAALGLINKIDKAASPKTRSKNINQAA